MHNSNISFIQNNLFSVKDNYLMSCTDTGKLKKVLLMSPAARRKAQIHNLHLSDGINLSDTNGFPIIKAYNGPIAKQFYPYSMHNQLTGVQQGLHFFEDDYKFAYATWNKLEQTTYKLKKFECLICPDHSLFVDASDALNKYNIYKSRFAGALWQNVGYNTIPTASWGNADSFRYCFESLPTNSIIAVCGIGINWCHSAYELWEYGIRELECQLNPTEIIIYGEPKTIRGLNTPTSFIPPYITHKFKK